MPTLFRKTAKGQAEIETRVHRLTPRLRGLLILVDGKRDQAGLTALVPQDVQTLLQQLITQGFIEAFEAVSAAAVAPMAKTPASTSASTPPAPALPAADFEKLRRDAVRAFTDLAGPAAETVAIRMERARSADELRPLLAQAAQVLANMRGRAAAEAYAQRFSSDA